MPTGCWGQPVFFRDVVPNVLPKLQRMVPHPCTPSVDWWVFNKEPLRLEGESSEKLGKELERRKWGGGFKLIETQCIHV